MHSQSVEDYLKAIYELEQKHGKAITTMLAEAMKVTPASVTGMIKKLAEMDLLEHTPYHGVKLTKAGQKIALEMIRRHRLTELFLVEILGVPWDRVHQEAHRIEHVLSDDIVERLDTVLGYPTTDPHGTPIPTPEGGIVETTHIRLCDLEAGQRAVIAQVSDRDPDLLRYLDRLGLYPGTEFQLLSVDPFEGPLTLRIGRRKRSLGPKVAEHIYVDRIPLGEPRQPSPGSPETGQEESMTDE
jgi:DtxR family Mn-dependent transcriptional regulator